MHLFRTTVPALLFCLTMPLAAQVRTLRVDANHTVLGFRASTVLFDVPGRFERYTAEIKGDPATLQGLSVRIEIDAASITTGNAQRDEHLRSADFFDVAKHPSILFTADKGRRDGEQLLLDGTLTIRGVSRPLSIPFQARQGLNGAGVPTWSYRAGVPIDRQGFGLGNESLAAKISLKRDVELDLLLVGFF